MTAKCVDAPPRPGSRKYSPLTSPPLCYITGCKILYSISN